MRSITVMIALIIMAAAALSMTMPGDTGMLLKAGEEMQWDRASVKDGAEFFGNEKRENEESLPPVKRWTLGKFLERSQYGTEKLQFADGGVWWVNQHDFLPLYRVKSSQQVEVFGVFAKPGYETAKKYESDKLERRTVCYLQPGDVVAADRFSQAILGTYVIYTADGKSGYAMAETLEPVGDPGP